MGTILPYGVNVGIAEPDPGLTLVVALPAGVLVVRYFVGLRFSPMVAVFGCLGGALWAYMVPGWGPAVTTLVAVITLLAARAVARHRPHPPHG